MCPDESMKERRKRRVKGQKEVNGDDYIRSKWLLGAANEVYPSERMTKEGEDCQEEMEFKLTDGWERKTVNE